jgi:very-short-patch-repair endonuclease
MWVYRGGRRRWMLHTVDLYEEALLLPHRLRGNARVPVTTTEVEAAGRRHSVGRQVRRRRCHRPVRGAYLLGRRAPNLLERVRCALLVAPPGAVVGLHTAAALQGFGVARTDDIHLLVPSGGTGNRKGLRVHTAVLPFDVVEVLGVPCTPPDRTAVDLARLLKRADALPVLDAALHAGACTKAQLEQLVTTMDGLRGVRQARELVAISDPRPQCRQESQLRLILHDGGITDFAPQLEVVTAAGSRFLDLGHAPTKVGLEYDGESHERRVRTDRRRHNALSLLDWKMRYFTAPDIYGPPAHVLTIVRAAMLG